MSDRAKALGVGVAALVPLLIVGIVLLRSGSDALQAQPGPTAPPEAIVWAVGDGADAESDAVRLSRFVARRRVDRFIYLGDVYGNPADWATVYGRTYGNLAARTAPTPGNHEWPNNKGAYFDYWQRVRGGPMPTHYSFELGGWKLLSLNSEEPTGPGSPQQRWLTEQVAGPGDCRLAFWHTPRFSGSLERGDEVRLDPLWSTLRGRARIVLNGHEHNMQRMKPRDGITQIISGAGGHSHYPVDRRDPRFAFLNDSDYAVLRLTLRPGEAEYAFVDDDGEILDSGRVECRVS